MCLTYYVFVITSIEDVAKAANVSTASVSRALRGLPGVGKSTRRHIIEVANQLGYVPLHSASTLASGRTGMVAMVMPDISRWFFSAALEGTESVLRDNNYDALVYSLPDFNGPRPAIDINVLRSRVDALIVTSIFFSQQETEQLRTLNLPCVFLSTLQTGFPHVGIDDEEAAEKACAHLIDLGHTVIGHLSGIDDHLGYNANKPTQRRRNGWTTTLINAGLDPSPDLDVSSAVMTAAGGYQAMKQLWELRPDVTGVFASSDEMAIGAMQAIREMGMEVGRDISVIGIDGHDLSEAVGLSTVAQPVYEQGEHAAQMILDTLRGTHTLTESDSAVFPTTLIQRASTQPVNPSRR